MLVLSLKDTPLFCLHRQPSFPIDHAFPIVAHAFPRLDFCRHHELAKVTVRVETLATYSGKGYIPLWVNA
jgi:hypothetical protein